MGTEECLDTMENGFGQEAGVFDCDDEDFKQVFEYSKKYQLKFQSFCLDSHSKEGPVKMELCVDNLSSQQWDYNKQVLYIKFYLKDSIWIF